MKKKRKRRQYQTGCHACKKKHNKNKTEMVRVYRPGDDGSTVHVCKAKAGSYEVA